MGVRVIIGDVRAALATLEPGSVDAAWTSPPFFGVRNYLPAGHPLKHLEIGNETTPAEYLDTMLSLVVDDIDRVLAWYGSIGFEVGDARSGSGGAGGDYNDEGLRAGQNRFDGTAAKLRKAAAAARGKPDGGSWRDRALDEALGIRQSRVRRKGTFPGYPPDKSLLGIPTLFAWSLAYGHNMLAEPYTAAELLLWVDDLVAHGYSTEAALAMAAGWVAEHGAEHRFARSFEQWRIRNVVAWAKPNPTVGAIGDRFRDAVSYITIACKSATRWFDLDAVRHENPRALEASRGRHQLNRGSPGYHTEDDEGDAAQNPLGAPPLDYWIMSPSQYRGSHYATMPSELCIIPIQSMVPRRVCLTCKEPSRRIVNAAPSPFTDLPGVKERRSSGRKRGPAGLGSTGIAHGNESRVATFIGWSWCECPATGKLWEDGWRGVYDEVQATLTEMRRRGITREERERIRANKLQPLYTQLAAMYLGRPDGFHDGLGWRPGVVLDPFGGTGTTGMVASSHGRDAILVDIDEDNERLMSERLGIFLESVEYIQ